MNRREFLLSSAALAAAPVADGQSISFGGEDYFLSDVVRPKPNEPAGAFVAAALGALLSKGRATGSGKARDRWGRLVGPVGIVFAGRTTTLQELLLAQGAARVFPQSDDFDFIERCYRAENAARAARLGLWGNDAYRLRDANDAEMGFGFEVYAGIVRDANERGSRVFLNFGENFRTDFTTTVTRSSFRRWRGKPEAASFVGRRVEARGLVDWINGPSIELRHEMQFRTAAS